MDKLAYKRKLIEKCLEQQDKNILNAKSAMDDIQESAIDYGQPQEHYDSYKSQLLRKRDVFAKQYEQTKIERELLKKIDIKKECKTVCFGAVVVTDDQKFIICISLGKITFNNETIFGISLKVPLYKVMEGLEKGNTFEFNGKKYQIKDIY
jgi:HD superfamily phosphohydrolase